MPYMTVWVPPDGEIEVLKELPKEAKMYGERAYIDDGKTFQQWYHCPRCEGWIEGFPDEHNEDTIGPMCGRRGTVTSCRCCGWELSFFGEQS